MVREGLPCPRKAGKGVRPCDAEAPALDMDRHATDDGTLLPLLDGRWTLPILAELAQGGRAIRTCMTRRVVCTVGVHHRASQTSTEPMTS